MVKQKSSVAKYFKEVKHQFHSNNYTFSIKKKIIQGLATIVCVKVNSLTPTVPQHSSITFSLSDCHLMTIITAIVDNTYTCKKKKNKFVLYYIVNTQQ